MKGRPGPVGEPPEPPPARGPPTDEGAFAPVYDGRARFQASLDELPAIDGRPIPPQCVHEQHRAWSMQEFVSGRPFRNAEAVGLRKGENITVIGSIVMLPPTQPPLGGHDAGEQLPSRATEHRRR